MIFSEKDIESHLNSQEMRLGREIILQGQISGINIQNGGQRISAIVLSPDLTTARVFIRANKHDNTFTLKGECSCEQKTNCEHIAAVLLYTVNSHTQANLELVKLKEASQDSFDRNSYNSVKQSVYYKLHVDSKAEHTIHVQVVVAQSSERASVSKEIEFNPSRALQRNPPRFLQTIDIEILSQLASLPKDEHSAWPVLTASEDISKDSDIMKNMLQSKRCMIVWKEHQYTLSLGLPRPLELFWEMDNHATQRLKWHTSPVSNALVMASSSPWYIDISTFECGPLGTDLTITSLAQLLALTPVSCDNAPHIMEILKKQFPSVVLPTIDIPKIHILPPTEPKPYLRMISNSETNQQEDQKILDYAILRFRYEKYYVNRTDSAVKRDGSRFIKLARDYAFEDTCHQQLLSLGFIHDQKLSTQTGEACYCVDQGVANPQWRWREFQLESSKNLEVQSWHIEYAPDFRQRFAQAQKWYCETNETEQPDFFSLSIGVEIDGEKVDLLACLVTLLREYPQGLNLKKNQSLPIILTLEDGRKLAVSPLRLAPIYNTLLELYRSVSTDNQKFHPIQTYQLTHVAEMLQAHESEPWQWLGNANIKQLAENLHDITAVPDVAPPTTLNASLRPYQQKGLSWLQFLSKHGLSGILADDMGLGKTLQTLAHILLEKQQAYADKPTLVVAPTSLMFNWRQECNRFCPSLKVLVLQGKNRHKHFGNLLEYDIVLTTYPLLVRDAAFLLSHKYHLLILDEAQTIKNPKSQVNQVARQLRAHHRLCLTGTPMENHLGELWSLFHFLMPGLLGTSRHFQQVYRGPIEKNTNKAVATRLAKRVKPFMLRRSKEEVAMDLPKKTEIILEVELDDAQRELYETIRVSMHRKIRAEIERLGIGRSQIIILDALLKLRQVCCDPRLVKTDSAKNVHQSAKLSLLEELLPQLIEEGRRILLFSQFTTMLDLIEDSVKKTGIAYTKLTGATRDRETQVSSFQNGEVPLFLISLKAGGVGLNLTAADTVIHYDPWWNPAVEHQATDRAHRIGQQKPVFVYKLICENTVEQSIQVLQQQKQALVNKLYNSTGDIDVPWSEQDIMQLFQNNTTTSLYQ